MPKVDQGVSGTRLNPTAGTDGFVFSYEWRDGRAAHKIIAPRGTECRVIHYRNGKRVKCDFVCDGSEESFGDAIALISGGKTK